MGKGRGSRGANENDTVKVEAADMANLLAATREEHDAEVLPGEIADPEAYEKAKAEGVLTEIESDPEPELELTKELRASKARRAAGEPQTAYPDKTAQMTAKRRFAAKRKDPIVQAFLHVESLSRIRKLSAAATAGSP